ncbi:MAG: isoprenylcysteine carboxylmethyltransferase family protein [Bacteroidales bacterium]|jgi:protein-S-isoprenylcysteine O-methyltransferase Ste14|nr:isoprenylcysteine carboxylmethyltransferase family protein [Bacteroidales bacterium]
MKTIQLISKGLAVSLFFFLTLFISAGHINYWQGWLYVSMNLFMTLMTAIASIGNTELTKERLRPGEGTKKWDKLLLGISALIYLIMLIVSGLDSGRFHWSPNLPWSLYILAIILTLSGHSFFLIAKRQNKFFSSVVRIQTERGHTVCDTGLYKMIRHPGYFGMIISTLGFPLLLGSLWSIIPVILSISVLVIRTYLEDKTLNNELTGYKEYSDKIRYKLIPKIW